MTYTNRTDRSLACGGVSAPAAVAVVGDTGNPDFGDYDFFVDAGGGYPYLTDCSCRAIEHAGTIVNVVRVE
ncbi:hypothetical protein [Dietzia lutea]|uniref:Uncharacterized protein n=1 Tax=Dietzia lutea TaxID=546160 RepID=A0A2S1RA25_9ACTN|nr:hypothetical protein [Dietzia lutea]AWH93137.1 hypothetical protein A6035_14210 [Dietzia lutea]